MRVELITDPLMASRGDRMLQAMIEAAPVEVRVRQEFVGDCDVLMVYGNGHEQRRRWWYEQLRRGGRCIGWDLGYWRHKDEGTCRMRVSIDRDHPQRMLRDEPPDRWDAEGIVLRQDADADGYVLVVGMGTKARRAHGLTLSYDRAIIESIRRAWPDARIVFKPKRLHDAMPAGVEVVRGGIEDVLRGAALVVCRHSNVAIDACIAGVPVVCQDGAAAALYGNDVTSPTVPTAAQRLAFLRSLAWWQWKPEEAALAWTYLLDRLEATSCV